MIKIPYNRPVTVGREMEYIEDAVKCGHISGVGKYTRKCEELISQLTDSPACLLTTSCTYSLEMMAILLNLQPGDEVIIPSLLLQCLITEDIADRIVRLPIFTIYQMMSRVL
ncbi:MAG: DegT/DnrJ/EryC1/StrS family aminotransferase [bacterium]